MTWDQLHEEDILYEFKGDQPDQLTPNRFYRGIVDGFADFGVFIELGDGVTGLLHRSQLEQRLESLDWAVGDEVIVQVDDVRDNGNVDLSWSIRQSPTEFRGHEVDDPTGEATEPTAMAPSEEAQEAAVAEPAETESEPSEPATSEDVQETTNAGTESAEPARSEEPSESGAEAPTASETEPAQPSPDEGTQEAAATAEASAQSPEPEATTDEESTGSEAASAARAREPITTAAEHVGQTVRVEGRVTSLRQTSGPTVFELTDESGIIDCAAFEAPGVRAYPDVEENDIVRVEGVVERHRESIQIEVEDLVLLDGTSADAVTDRLETAITEQARPQETTLLVEGDPSEAIAEEIEAAATALRRAAIQGRPVVLRHPATVDGYVGAAALERAVSRAIEAEHEESQAADRLVTRRPMRERWYELGDAFYDIPDVSEAEPPVVVLVGAGASDEDREAVDLLGLYGIDRIVIDTTQPTDTDGPRAEHVLSPEPAGGIRPTATSVAANLAAVTSRPVRSELFHLPAISYWGPVPDAYGRIARDNGFDEDTVRQRREAIALVAYYQQYDDKRELVTDLLFDGEQAGDLAGHVSRQYREKVETAVEIATANREQFSVTGGRVTIIDVEELHDPRSFPPVQLLVGELQQRWEAGPEHAIVAIGADTCYVVGSKLDLTELAAALAKAVPDAGVTARRDRISFLAGKRDDLRAALVDEFAVAFDTSSTRS